MRGGAVFLTALAASVFCGAAFSLAADYRVVARVSGPAPGGPSGATFKTIGVFDPFVFPDQHGRTAFVGAMTTGVGGVTSSNDTGVWSEGGGSLNLLAHEGNQAPGSGCRRTL